MQVLGQADICDLVQRQELVRHLPQRVDVVYSDPPWNPGNEKYWRNHAGALESYGYDKFLMAWHSVIAACIERGARHIFCEQSDNQKHRQMFLDSISWSLPFVEEWTVFYGLPSSRSRLYPNRLLHFGYDRIKTDPSGMSGQEMTTRVCAGLDLAPGAWIVDPCIGKGMTSRMAHLFGWNCLGSELNQSRLGVTIRWLVGQGYAEKPA